MSLTSATLQEWIQACEGTRRSAPGLAGVEGLLLLELEGNPLATLRIDNGHAQLARDTRTADAAAADAVADFSEEQALIEVLSGELNPVVAILQGRMHVSGNHIFATKTVLGLQVDKPFGSSKPEKEMQHAR